MSAGFSATKSAKHVGGSYLLLHITTGIESRHDGSFQLLDEKPRGKRATASMERMRLSDSTS
jgi:hypothetical protein